MKTCKYQELYKTEDKIGVVCTRSIVSLRITCNLVCEICQDREAEKPKRRKIIGMKRSRSITE